MIMQQQQQPPSEAAVAMLCLQAQQVTGLPDAAEGRHIQLSTTTTTTSTPAAAVSVCRAGVADFHRQVLLLHCAPVKSIDAVAIAVTMADATTCNDDDQLQHPTAAAAEARIIIASVTLDLAEQLRRPACPSPSVLSFVLGVSGSIATTATAVLSLTLHHRLLVATTRRTGCCNSLLRSCLRLPLPLAGCCCRRPPVLWMTTKQNHRWHQPNEAADNDGDADSSSSGFITIDKKEGTAISRRRPPSDYLLTTTDDDDDEVDGKRPPGPPTTCCRSLSSLDNDISKVENDFLAMLMHDDDDDDLNLDALIRDADRGRPHCHMAKPRMIDDRGAAPSAS